MFPAQRSRQAFALLALLAGCSEPAPTPEKSGVEVAAGEAVEAAVDTAEDYEPAPFANLEAARARVKRVGADDLVLSAMLATTWVYDKPNRQANKLGYLRLGGRVARAQQPVSGRGCRGFWYPVQPVGFVCTEDATLDTGAALARAAQRGPARERPLPYRYARVHVSTPEYLRIPSAAENEQPEANRNEPRASLGADDVPLDLSGRPELGKPLEAERLLSTQWTENEWYRAQRSGGTVPFWLQKGRSIPFDSVSGSDETRLSVGTVAADTRLSFVDSFEVQEAKSTRGFAVTVGLCLIPIATLTPEPGSMFHGVVPVQDVKWPLAFVKGTAVRTWRLFKGEDEAEAAERLPHRVVVPMSGSVRYKAKRRFYQTRRDPTAWLSAEDIALVIEPPSFPKVALRGEKWIDVSLSRRTLVLYEGKDAKYATLISAEAQTGGVAGGVNEVALGSFRIESKHVSANRGPDETGPGALVEPSLPELRDVPWIQRGGDGVYLYGAYWHDDFGAGRGEGGIALSPIDARYVFSWTEPQVPTGWHGHLHSSGGLGRGTTVVVRE